MQAILSDPLEPFHTKTGLVLKRGGYSIVFLFSSYYFFFLNLRLGLNTEARDHLVEAQFTEVSIFYFVRRPCGKHRDQRKEQRKKRKGKKRYNLDGIRFVLKSFYLRLHKIRERKIDLKHVCIYLKYCRGDQI